jgi:hypothetical protein
VSLVFIVIGAVAFVTGLVGWCPLYSLFDVSTKKRVGDKSSTPKPQTPPPPTPKLGVDPIKK